MRLELLETEKQNERTREIDRVSTLRKLELMNAEDQLVAAAVQKILPDLAKAVDKAAERLAKGGHVYYVGAGTSGRLGVLDASECPPTYGVAPDLFVGIIAGGKEAMFKAKEGAEDRAADGQEDLKQVLLNENDVVFGLAASGRTPYVIGALAYANEVGALTISLCCVNGGRISRYAQYPLEVLCGPEAITGSTRMKAGTAQKMVLNMFSSALMIKQGKVYQNLMVDVKPTNEKLVSRACRIIAACTDVSLEEAQAALIANHQDVKCAIISLLGQCSYEKAKAFLELHHGHVANAIEELRLCTPLG